jgi:hypothetical protein
MRYGELVVRFLAGDDRTRFTMPPEFEEFRVGEGSASHCDVSWRLGAITPPPREPDLPGEVWSYWRAPDGGDQIVFYRGDERLPYATMQFDPSLRQVRVVHDPGALGSTAADIGLYPMSEILVSRLLSQHDAVDLHASTAVLDGKAYVFMGHSGAGKTTISEIALRAGATVLSDDRTIVGVRDGQVIAWGTPWHGTGRRSSSRTAPVAGIFLLMQSQEERVVPVTPARAFKEMFVRLIHQRLTTAEVDAALRTTEAIAAAGPMWELHFRPIPEAFELVLRTGR